MFSKVFTAGLAAFAPLVAAYTKPTGDAPVGNPISQPGLNSVVPVGEGFTITWNPTTQGTVTLVLLKGPSENAVPQYAIVEKTENDGSYVWTPSTDLEASEGAKGYGIQLIDDATGQYQYTTQFGISNPKHVKANVPANPPTYGAPSTSSSTSSVSSSASSESKTMEMPTPYAPKATSTYMTKPMYGTGVTSAYVPKPTGYWTANTTMVAPTGHMPSSTMKTSAATNVPSATYEGPSQQTGAASNVAISVFGLVAAAGAAVFAI
ncbi:hypothetical protein SMMN14_03380 [Sphaerulina musiva]